MKTAKLVRFTSKRDQKKPMSTLDSFINLKNKHINWNQSQITQPRSYFFSHKRSKMVSGKDKLKVEGISHSQRIVFQRNDSLRTSQNGQNNIKKSIFQEKESSLQYKIHNQSSEFLSYHTSKRLKSISLSHDLKQSYNTSNSFKNETHSQWQNKSKYFNVRKGKGYKLLELIGKGYQNKALKKQKLDLSNIKTAEA